MTVQEGWIESCLSSRFGGGSGQFANFSKEEKTRFQLSLLMTEVHYKPLMDGLKDLKQARTLICR